MLFYYIQLTHCHIVDTMLWIWKTSEGKQYKKSINLRNNYLRREKCIIQIKYNLKCCVIKGKCCKKK